MTPELVLIPRLPPCFDAMSRKILTYLLILTIRSATYRCTSAHISRISWICLELFHFMAARAYVITIYYIFMFIKYNLLIN